MPECHEKEQKPLKSSPKSQTMVENSILSTKNQSNRRVNGGSHLAAAFADYDPLVDREDDTPYDVDHMIPRSDWGFDWGYRNERLDPIERFAPSDLNNRLRWSRSDIGNAIGNKWLIESSTNRGWGNKLFPDKLGEILLQANRGESPYSVLINGAFDLDALQHWIVASNGNNWTNERMIAFQEVVECRSFWLYTRFYNESGLAQWIGNDQH